MILLLLLASSAFLFGQDCLAVSGDRIHMEELASVRAEFAAVEGSLEIAPAPAPGSRKSFTAEDLQNLANTHGLAIPATAPVCFVRRMRTLDISEIRRAIQQVLPTEASQLLVEEFSRFPTPEGTLVMPPAGLQAVSGNISALWRGYVKYDGEKRFPVWAKVNVRIAGHCLIAAEAIPAHTAIAPQHFQEEECGLVPFVEKSLRLNEVSGWTTNRPVSRGHRLLAADLSKPAEIRRGDVVSVKATHGRASLSLGAMAENSGHVGQVVTLRNPLSGKRFQAKVVGPGRAQAISQTPTRELRTELR